MYPLFLPRNIFSYLLRNLPCFCITLHLQLFLSSMFSSQYIFSAHPPLPVCLESYLDPYNFNFFFLQFLPRNIFSSRLPLPACLDFYLTLYLPLSLPYSFLAIFSLLAHPYLLGLLCLMPSLPYSSYFPHALFCLALFLPQSVFSPGLP